MRAVAASQVASRLIPVVILAVAALFASGCGSSDTASDTNSAADWASGVCTSVSTWTTSIASVGTSLKNGNLTKDSLTSAVDDAKEATQTFADDLKGLGTPDIEAGDQAKSTIDTLVSDLNAGITKIEDAATSVSGLSSIVSAVATISNAIVTMGNQVGAAFTSLKSLDAKGELEDAFTQTSACDSLTK